MDTYGLATMAKAFCDQGKELFHTIIIWEQQFLAQATMSSGFKEISYTKIGVDRRCGACQIGYEPSEFDFRDSVQQDRLSVKGKRGLPFYLDIPKHSAHLLWCQPGFPCHFRGRFPMIQAGQDDVHQMIGKNEVELVLALLEAIGIGRRVGRKGTFR